MYHFNNNDNDYDKYIPIIHTTNPINIDIN